MSTEKMNGSRGRPGSQRKPLQGNGQRNGGAANFACISDFTDQQRPSARRRQATKRQRWNRVVSEVDFVNGRAWEGSCLREAADLQEKLLRPTTWRKCRRSRRSKPPCLPASPAS